MSPLPPPVSGISSWTVNLLEFIEKSGINSIKHFNTAVHFRTFIHKNSFQRFYTGVLGSTLIFWRYFWILITSKPEIIHLTSSASWALFKDLVIITFAKIFRVKVILHLHFGRIPQLSEVKDWEWKLLLLIIRNSDKTIVIDEASLHTLLNEKFENVVYIPNPISLNLEFLAKDESGNQKIREKNSIIFVGHVIETKGVYELITACSDIENITKLTIIGPIFEKVKNNLELTLHNLNSSLNLVFLGAQLKERVLDMMCRSSILVLPSYTEGFPNVILEAMACGCTIIASNVGAIPEMLAINSEKPCGICIPPKDINALRIAIKSVLSDDDLRCQYAIRAKERVLSNYTMDIIYPKYSSLWV